MTATPKVSYFKSKEFKKNLNPLVIITLLILIAYALSIILPLLMGLNASFKHRSDFNQTQAHLAMITLPDLSFWKNSSIENYDNIFGNYISAFANNTVQFGKKYFVGFNLQEKAGTIRPYDFYEYIVNTVLYCVCISIIPTLAALIVAYLAANYDFRFSAFLYGYVIFNMTVPIGADTSVLITFLRRFYLYDSIIGYAIINFSYPTMYFLIFYGYFKGLAGTYAEAADIDGASQIRIMFQIYFPLCITMFGTVVLIQFVTAWNDYNTSLLMLPSYPTIALAVWRIQGNAGIEPPKKFAVCMTLTVPIIILFIFFKDKLMGNLSLGGLKE